MELIGVPDSRSQIMIQNMFHDMFNVDLVFFYVTMFCCQFHPGASQLTTWYGKQLFH